MNNAPVFWFTGLSGAGKSTVAEGVRQRLEQDGRTVLILDGDDVRERLHRHLGFSEAEIKENNALIAELCASRRRECDVILVPIISPFAVSRCAARARLEPGFYEIHFAVGLDTVTTRDTKGLYARAARGEIDNMIGMSDKVPYEPPEQPDLVLDTADETQARSIDRLYRFVTAHVDHGD